MVVLIKAHGEAFIQENPLNSGRIMGAQCLHQALSLPSFLLPAQEEGITALNFQPRLLGSLLAAALTQKYSPQNRQSDTILIQPQSCVVQAESYISVVQS